MEMQISESSLTLFSLMGIPTSCFDSGGFQVDACFPTVR